MLPIQTGFPNSPQSTFTPVYDGPQIGDVWEQEVFNPGNVSYFLPRITEVSQVNTLVIGNNTPANILTITIDGVSVTAVVGANLAATVAAVVTAISTPALLAAVVTPVGSSPNVVLTFSDAEPHTVAVSSSGATTITGATPTTLPVANAKLDLGMHVAKRAAIGTVFDVMGQPSALTDIFAGVLIRYPGSGPFTDTQQIILGQSTEWLPTNRSYILGVSGISPVVQFVGTAPTVLDKVYRVCTGANYGKFAASDLGVAQVTRGDVVFNATDDVGLTVDSLPPLFVPSNTSDDQTAADLRDAWNASAQHFAVATATIDTSGSESYIILTFKDYATHTVVAYSPATADITGITNTTIAIAASAVLLPNATWGRPSISGVSGTPNRAFLRLSPA